ncbi:MAG: hypothetical protein PUC58_05375 [Oscillospiraceae bacterium]|nr:hypothetical protein [Oscillospiraceae bacterium]
MRYYKQLSDNYILAIGTGNGGEEITEAEYNNIMTIIRNRPQAEGKGYKLKADLTWEEYDLPPEPEPSDDDEISNGEALDILLGGAT